jgi:hypothetical protein
MPAGRRTRDPGAKDGPACSPGLGKQSLIRQEIIDFVGHFRALKRMKYAGTLSLKTPYRNAQRDLYPSSVASMDGLVHVVQQV